MNELCGNCNGSGEGYSAGSRCGACKGSGINEEMMYGCDTCERRAYPDDLEERPDPLSPDEEDTVMVCSKCIEEQEKDIKEFLGK